MKLHTTFTILTVTMMILAKVNSSSNKLENSSLFLEKENKSLRETEKAANRQRLTESEKEEKSKAILRKEGDKKVVGKIKTAISDRLAYSKTYKPAHSPISPSDNKFIVLGDTGQIDEYFTEYVKRCLMVKCTPKECKDKIQPAEYPDVTFPVLAQILNNTKETYNRGIILGDFVYTENKNCGVSFSKFDELKDEDNEDKKKDFKKKILYNETEKTGDISYNDIFEKRITQSTEKLFELLSFRFSKVTPFWLLLSGNHSYDIDAKVELDVIKNKGIRDGKEFLKMAKNSKVEITNDACFADLNFGDLVCLGKSYYECLGSALGGSRYGRTEKQTDAALKKLIEAVLTLRLCNTKWRIIRTHAAPFNTEIDQHQLFINISDKNIKCKIRNEIPNVSLKVTDIKSPLEILKILKDSNVDLTPEQLKTASTVENNVINRLFNCELPEESQAEAQTKAGDTKSTVTIMKLVNEASPHFYLASHLHASQILFAPLIDEYQDKKFNTFIKSNEFEHDLKGCKIIDRFDILNDLEKLKMPLSESKVCDAENDSKQVEIKIKNEPEYNVIFVIGNSGRFLDPFMDGKGSMSDVVWQRIKAEKGLPITLMKQKSTRTDFSDAAIKKDVDEILEANKMTSYGFAELLLEKNTATITFKDYDFTTHKTPIVKIVKITKGNTKSTPYVGSKQNNMVDRRDKYYQLELEKKEKAKKARKMK